MKLELDKNMIQKVQSDIGLFLSRYPESPFAKDVKALDAKLAKK
jgi:outer membrane protein assembly factor BamD (BamD/ComL family)